ncbi:tyrosine-type recombinase/integrase [Paramaledivibacter caminithermalis]|jgi:site-specific recombinase XerD|uniref:Site-specific recombinase XerD n=1 Tax=Paramaledivibacter caminithermalis (strain DSM 15212 / CIP 107654 / DViRD3) TaxID=1121301 RepID=A0A1M6JJZ4_PARC5|nr:tyrosine-type recombinase/integrase [Paramaledivibacter caminithermalis]SHJ47061.1 Site-specific recombinase XerD [Paramaledivibacter caminithermalis DSM 15212]
MSKIIVSDKNRSDIPSNVLIEREVLREKLESLKVSSPPILIRYMNFLYINETARSVNINTALKYTREIIRFLMWLIKERIITKPDIQSINKQDLNNIEAYDIQQYLDSCGSYTEINSKGEKVLYSNSIRTIFFKSSCIRGFFTWLYKNNYIEKNETEKLRKIITPELPPVIALTDDEVKAMLELAEYGKTKIYDNTVKLSKKEMEIHSKTKYRDLAILSMFVYHGLRIHELYHLNLSSLYFDKDYFEIYRKRNKKRNMYFSKYTKNALENYINLERPKENITPEDTDALFISTREHRRLSIRQIRRIVKKYAVKVSGNPKLSPHKLRATFATKAIEITGNIYKVQKNLDHSSPNTTQRYLKEDEKFKKEIAAAINYD